MAFSDNLQQLPAIDHLRGIDLIDQSGQVVATIDNKPGQAGSVRVYAALAAKHGRLDAAAATEGLAIYAEHTADSHANPGKHPNIDRLIALIDSGEVLTAKLLPAVKIYHNPGCGTSRNTLALIRNSGAEPEVIEYLKTPLSREQLAVLVADLGIAVRELVRDKGPLYEELALNNPQLSDDQLLDALASYPALMNRPVVVTPKGTRLCRPSELVLDILPGAQQGPFTKEDGEQVIDEHGQRVSPKPA